ncbi:MAG: mannitol dehydrogenase family protein [Candidatus Ancillula sp.]|jgi:fructuronate reductase|nr:mannitol dehydrogenase family protein [Candidatus Ancillula sp.]
MVNISDDYNVNRAAFEAAAIKVPSGYLMPEVIENTSQNPTWVHFGGGNLFRCMQAVHSQTLLEKGLSNTGIILAETWDDGLIEGIYDQYQNRTLDVILKSDGTYDLELIDSVTEAHYVNANDEKGKAGFMRMKEIFQNPSLQLATFTVTEKGYNIKDLQGQFFPPVAEEIEDGPENPVSLMGVVTALMLARFEAGALPIALVSTDNFSHNGDKLKASITQIASAWQERGYVSAGFIAYLNDAQKVGFPYSMIDRITPAPSEDIASKLSEQSISPVDILKTDKFSTSAAFVNTEETNYLVIEDNFPAGRPPLEEAGVIFTSREKVDEVERMKVCTCLNPLHTALAVTGCLLGFTKIWQGVGDDALLNLIRKIGYTEGMPVVTDPGIISPIDFIDEVIKKRLPNPYIPDTPQRIATDTSQKLPIRFGVTISLYKDSLHLDVKNLQAISFTLAAWLRYLLGVDDEGNAFERSPDPMFPELDPVFSTLKLGDNASKLEVVKPFLKDSNIFGVDLEAAGLSEKVFKFFVRMAEKPGAVREVLEEVAFC